MAIKEKTLNPQPNLVLIKCHSREHAEAVLEEEWSRGREAYLVKPEQHSPVAIFVALLCVCSGVLVVVTSVLIIVVHLFRWVGLI